MLNSDLIKDLWLFWFLDFFTYSRFAEYQCSAEHTSSLGNAADVLGVHEPNIHTKRHPSVSYGIRFTLYHVPDRHRLSLLKSCLGSFQPNPEILIP